MKIVADLHLHSKYSRAVSKDMSLPFMEKWAKVKGIDLLGTSDWTHPLWFKEIRELLTEAGEGVYKLKGGSVNFVLSTEISSIYKQGGKLRRVHNLVFAPDFEVANKINAELVKRGCNLKSDGRPIIGLSSRDLAEIVFSISDKSMIVPAHVWTPWFALYGSMSGFDSIDEAFGEFSKYIYAVETGLSSDPIMNWRVKELDNRMILSFSDSHSGAKLGREATVFEGKGQMEFADLRMALTGNNKAHWKVSHTVEFYPEEGKYHYSGHRKCKVRQAASGTCPVCGKPLTAGVMQRVDVLAGRTNEDLKVGNVEIGKCKGINNGIMDRPSYINLVGLSKIIAEALKSGESSKKVQKSFFELIDNFKTELNILVDAEISEISKVSNEKIAEGVDKVRKGDIVIDPGYDGEYGVVSIWGKKRQEEFNNGQMNLSLN